MEALTPEIVDPGPARTAAGAVESNGWTEKRTLLVAGLARGLSVTDAGACANMSRRAAYRNVARDDVQEQLRAIRARTLSEAASAAAAATGEAVERVVELMRSAKSESTRLRAAETLLAYASGAQAAAEQSAELAVLRAEVERVVGASPSASEGW